MAINTTNAVVLRFQVSNASQRSRVRMHSGTLGFPATPSANRQEAVMSPAVGATPATELTFTVRSVAFLQFSGKADITIVKPDATQVSLETSGLFYYSVDSSDGPYVLKVTPATNVADNVNVIAVWS